MPLQYAYTNEITKHSMIKADHIKLALKPHFDYELILQSSMLRCRTTKDLYVGRYKPLYYY